MKIAVIGAGISGNVAARLLCGTHDVAVFEAEPRAGGHSRTLTVRAFGADWRVDTGFMVYNERTYPNFCRLLRLLGVAGRPTDMSFSVSGGGLEYQGSSLNGLFAQRRNLVRPAFLAMLRDIVRFNRAAPAMLESACSLTIGEVLARDGYGRWFIDKYLVPMAAAIWSCPPGQLLDFPAHFLIGFLRNHGLLQMTDRPQWLTIPGGASVYVERLTAPFRARLRTDCRVQAVWRCEDHVVIQPEDGPAELFDAVVLACHADQALQLLPDADAVERQALQAFPYQRNCAVLHTDCRLLPARRRAWASWNYRIAERADLPAAVTYDLSRLQGLPTPSPLLLTLNGTEAIDPDQVLDQHAFQHPVYTRAALAAQQQLRRLNGRRRTYYCGAYRGFGFHEDGVNSALDAARHLGIGWESWTAASTTAWCGTNG